VQAEEVDSSSSVKVEKASYAVYTPSMAARGERFYVGRDWSVSHPQTLKEEVMKKTITIIGGLFLLSASISPVLAFEGQFNPKEALEVNHHPTLVVTFIKTGA